MSTILKALQRLEEEKSAGRDRSLNEQIVARRSRAAGKNRWALVGMSLLGGIAVGSSALFFWRAFSEAEPDLMLETAQPVVVSSASQPEPRISDSLAKTLGTAEVAPARNRERTVNRSATRDSPMVEVVERLEEKPPAESLVAESSDPEPDTRGTSRPGERRRAARQRAKERADSTPGERVNPRPAAVALKRVPEPQEAVSPMVVAAADPTEVTASTGAAPIENLAPMPDPPLGAAEPSEPISVSRSSFAPPSRDRKVIRRAEIPLISIEKTIWHPDVDRRSAVVELVESGEKLRLKKGDAIGPLVIESIRPGGVLFVHDGVEVEYRIGQ